MSLDEEKRHEMVLKYLDKSAECWSDAEAARSLGKWSMTANRIYYSLVNALRAMLLQDGHPVHTHAGIRSLFGQHYVVTQLFSIDEGKLLSQWETMRERADYDCYFNATESDIEEKYDRTRLFLNHIFSYIQQN